MATSTTIGVFETHDQAQTAIKILIANGFAVSMIHVVSAVDAMSTLRALPGGDADFYRDVVNRNGVLVVVQTTPERIQQAAEILVSRTINPFDADTITA